MKKFVNYCALFGLLVSASLLASESSGSQAPASSSGVSSSSAAASSGAVAGASSAAGSGANWERSGIFVLVSAVLSVAWIPNSELFSICSDDGAVRVWNAKNLTLVKELIGSVSWASSIAWSADGTRFAGGGRDKIVYIVGTAEDYVYLVYGHRDWVTSVSWSPDGKSLATGSMDKTVRIWNLSNLNSITLRALHNHESGVLSVAFSPDGKSLASAGYGTVHIWDVASGELIHKLSGRSGDVCSVAWSSDSTLLASVGCDGIVRIWDVAKGTLAKELKGQTGRILSVAWSHDGEKLATGSSDGVVWVWNVANGALIKELSHTGNVLAVVWSFDDKFLAIGGGKTVRIWRSGERVSSGIASGAYWSRFGNVLYGMAARLLGLEK